MSEVRVVYWSHTLEDINEALRFKVAEKQLEAVQSYEAFMAVAVQALGADEKDKSSVSTQAIKPENQAHTSAQALNLFSNIFNRR